jgi:small subunit ribosomal protein S17
VTEERNNGTPEGAEPQEVAPEATEPEAATATEPETAESAQGPDPERAETPQDLIEGETVDAGLAPSAFKGPALDQDEGQVQSDTERNRRKERVGLVVSDKAEKTVTVRVETLVRHPRYKKRIRRSKRFMVHDEGNEARAGDTVRIIETRPLSARKRWRLANIISRAE